MGKHFLFPRHVAGLDIGPFVELHVVGEMSSTYYIPAYVKNLASKTLALNFWHNCPRKLFDT